MKTVVAITLAGLVACGCTRPPRSSTTPDPVSTTSAPPTTYPGALIDPAQLHPDFMARQRIEGRYGDQGVAFDAVVQKRGDTLVVLAMTPYGSRAAVITQRGEDVEFERFVPRPLPFEPRFIILDVQRTFFIGLSDAPRPDGWHRGQRAGESIRERWQDGRLYEREFRRQDQHPEGTIHVAYQGGMIPGQAPPPIVFTNGWFGYHLEIEPLEYHVLDALDAP